eukprot:2758908-Ditylum_brightwellii.AAC.1
MTLHSTKKAALEKKAKNIETNSATKRKAVNNNTECSDDSNDSRSNSNKNNINDYSKTDQMGATPTTNFPASMQSNNKSKSMQKMRSLTERSQLLSHYHPSFQ